MTWTWALVFVLSPLCGRNLPAVSQVSGHWLRGSRLQAVHLPLWLALASLELVKLKYNDGQMTRNRTASPLSFHDLVLPSNKFSKLHLVRKSSHCHVWQHLLLWTTLFKYEIYKVSHSLPAKWPPPQWHFAFVYLINQSRHWITSLWQTPSTIPLICMSLDKTDFCSHWFVCFSLNL